MKEDFGPFGRFRRKKWEKELLSGKAPFDPLPKANLLKRIKGPTFEEDKGLQGHSGGFEEFLIIRELDNNPDLKKTYDGLKKVNPVAAKEFIYVKTNIFEIWKKDVFWLNEVIKGFKKKSKELTDEKKILTEEEKLAEKEEELVAKTEIPDTLKRHFPNIFSDLHIDHPDFDSLIDEITDKLNFIHDKEEFLRDYLTNLRKDIPILFRDIDHIN